MIRVAQMSLVLFELEADGVSVCGGSRVWSLAGCRGSADASGGAAVGAEGLAAQQGAPKHAPIRRAGRIYGQQTAGPRCFKR